MSYAIVFILGIFMGAFIASKGFRDRIIREIKNLSNKKKEAQSK